MSRACDHPFFCVWFILMKSVSSDQSCLVEVIVTLFTLKRLQRGVSGCGVLGMRSSLEQQCSAAPWVSSRHGQSGGGAGGGRLLGDGREF